MATGALWTGGASQVFATAGNWSDASAPADGETRYLDNSSVSVDGAATGMDSFTLYVSPTFTGSIGTSAAPLNFSGTTTPNIVKYNGRLVPAAFFSAGNQVGNTFYAYDTNRTANACVIAGVWTDVYVFSGNVTITGTITNLHTLGASANVTIQTGAVVTNVYQRGGHVLNEGIGHTLLNVYRGTYFVNTATAVTFVAANVFPGSGVLKFWSRAGIITALTCHGGITTMIGHDTAHTITAGTVHVGATLECNPATTGAITQLGGKVVGSGLTTTPTIDEWSGGTGGTGV